MGLIRTVTPNKGGRNSRPFINKDKKVVFVEYAPLLTEGQRVMQNGLKKDTSRYGIGSDSSKKDSAKSCKRPKKLAAARVRAKDNAIEIQKAIAQNFDNARFQIDMFIDKNSTEEIKDPPAFLVSKIRKAGRDSRKKVRR